MSKKEVFIIVYIIAMCILFLLGYVLGLNS